MYQDANRWMKKPTPVMTDIMVSDRASTCSVKVGAKLPTLIQVHMWTETKPPSGGAEENCQMAAAVVRAEMPTLPTPMTAARFSDMRLRDSARIRKPNSGATNTKGSQVMRSSDRV